MVSIVGCRMTMTHVRRWVEHRHRVGWGSVYGGRYKSFAVQDDRHLLAVLRCVERNPLRSGLAERAEAWRWSRFGATATNKGSQIRGRESISELTPDPFDPLSSDRPLSSLHSEPTRRLPMRPDKTAPSRPTHRRSDKTRPGAHRRRRGDAKPSHLTSLSNDLATLSNDFTSLSNDLRSLRNDFTGLSDDLRGSRIDFTGS
jgi:hypothetical protein